MEKLENHECYLLGFKNASKKLENNEKELEKVSPCVWSINAYESYINGYKDGYKDLLYYENRFDFIKLTK